MKIPRYRITGRDREQDVEQALRMMLRAIQREVNRNPSWHPSRDFRCAAEHARHILTNKAAV